MSDTRELPASLRDVAELRGRVGELEEQVANLRKLVRELVRDELATTLCNAAIRVGRG